MKLNILQVRLYCVVATCTSCLISCVFHIRRNLFLEIESHCSKPVIDFVRCFVGFLVVHFCILLLVMLREDFITVTSRRAHVCTTSIPLESA